MAQSVTWFGIRCRLVEWIKYDTKWLGIIPGTTLLILSIFLWNLGKKSLSFKLFANVYNSNWLGSEKLTGFYLKRTLKRKHQLKKECELLKNAFLNNLPLDEKKSKFLKNPTLLFVHMLIVIRKRTEVRKGIIILKYSYYFPLMFKFFDMRELVKHYHLVLEPSWAGYLDMSVFSYLILDEPVFVMTYEEKDKRLLDSLNSNLVPIEIGPNWWVDFSKFSPQQDERDVDLMIMASWSTFKRHYFIFRALRQVKRSKPDLKVVLAGYRGDLGLDFIKSLAHHFGIEDCLDIYEKVPSDQVALLLGRAKVNILWSRFEGNNRSIIEGFFCDTPAILREGHNFGFHYPYINEQTGKFSNEHDLADNILYMIDNAQQLSPRQYVMREHNYKVATDKILQAISPFEINIQEAGHVAYKVNLLKGMEYMDEDEHEYSEDYQYLKSLVTIQ